MSCIECLEMLEELEGWETTSGVVMCSECFATIHGPTRSWHIVPPAPTVRKREPSAMFWLTGPDGERIHTDAFTLVDSRPTG